MMLTDKLLHYVRVKLLLYASHERDHLVWDVHEHSFVLSEVCDLLKPQPYSNKLRASHKRI